MPLAAHLHASRPSAPQLILLEKLSRLLALLLLALLTTAPGVAYAQFGNLDELSFGSENSGFIPQGFGAATEQQPSGDPVTVTSRFTAPQAGQPAMLIITAKVAPSYHIYSLTQPPGGPQATSIELKQVDGVSVDGQFQATPQPKTHIDQKIWTGLEIQEHEGTVHWWVPLKVTSGTDLSQLKLTGTVSLQACQANTCEPLDLEFKAGLGDAPADFRTASGPQAAGVPATPTAIPSAPSLAATYQAQGSSVQWTGWMSAAKASPGDRVVLYLKAKPQGNWHLYTRRDTDDGSGSKPTLITIEPTAGITAYQAQTTAPVVESDQSAIGFGIVKYHPAEAVWTVPLKVASDASLGPITVGGLVGYQACESSEGGYGSCELPQGVRFTTNLDIVDSAVGAGPAGLAFAKDSYFQVAKAAAQIGALPPAPDAAMAAAQQAGADVATSADNETSTDSLVAILGAALLGGLILNLMPCVLPVIGLKVLSFAEQGGQSRGRILGFNLAYSAGLISVFMVLATLASLTSLGLSNTSYGWGELYTLLWFKVMMTSLVFAMALSFLGIWEIPLPGFVGTGKAAELQTKEGYTGAFIKGAFTTLLATPCSAPLLGPVFAATIGQPPSTTYLFFLFVGLGMASPYLLIGAFPSLVRWLPKPGMWMVTFKELMGFVLLGTMVYLLSTVGSAYVIPTMALLVGIWFACWWIGRTPLTASAAARNTSWVGGMMSVALSGLFAFTALIPSEGIPWKEYSPANLAAAQKSGNVVMVDFTADWCLTCKWNLKTAINTEATREVVEANNVKPLLADWTERSDTIKQALEELQSRSIPLLAIYPAGRPEDVIVLRDTITESQLLEALAQAGAKKANPAVDGGSEPATAAKMPEIDLGMVR